MAGILRPDFGTLMLGGVDPVARAEILREVLDFLDEDKTVLMATHLAHDIEPMLDEVIFLQGGQVISHASAEKMRETRGQSVEEWYLAVYGGGARR